MKFYDTKIKAFVFVGVHGGKTEKSFVRISTKVGVDEDGNDITIDQEFARGYTFADIPKHWLQIEDNDPRFGLHPGKRLVYVAGTNAPELTEDDDGFDFGSLALEDTPAPTQAQQDRKAWKVIKAGRDAQVKKIVVTLEQDGVQIRFDGDEISQDRMIRAVGLADNLEQTTSWKDADNVWRHDIKASTLKHAALLAGLEQTRIMTEAEA